MPDKSWKLLSSRQIGDYRVLRLREDHYLFEPTQAEADFVVCDSRDWVLVIPVTTDGEIALIRQYRHGVQQVVLEVPGGVVDPGETALATAARELREETGYEAQELRLLGRLMPNPAINNAFLHVVLAKQCRRVGEPHFDPLERIEVMTKPINDVPAMIACGEMSHALVIAAFALAGMVGPSAWRDV